MCDNYCVTHPVLLPPLPPYHPYCTYHPYHPYHPYHLIIDKIMCDNYWPFFLFHPGHLYSMTTITTLSPSHPHRSDNRSYEYHPYHHGAFTFLLIVKHSHPLQFLQPWQFGIIFTSVTIYFALSLWLDFPLCYSLITLAIFAIPTSLTISTTFTIVRFFPHLLPVPPLQFWQFLPPEPPWPSLPPLSPIQFIQPLLPYYCIAYQVKAAWMNIFSVLHSHTDSIHCITTSLSGRW